jgi:dCMP deaminase
MVNELVQNKSLTHEGCERPSIDTYFMKMAQLVSERSTCIRRKVGAIIVKNKRVLSTGYNGAPKSLAHCREYGCIREKLQVQPGERHELCRGVHAEQNAIIQAAVFGVSIKDATVYTTNHPCSVCAKMLINADIDEIVYLEGYADELGKQLLAESGMKLRQFTFTSSPR